MKKAALAAAALGAVTISALAAAVVGSGPSAGTASSHREAPLISEDPSADNTDLYAFRSPDKPSTVTIVSNWIPAEDPAAGPNYYTFSPSREVQHPHRPQRRRAAGPHLPVPLRPDGRPRVPRQHRPELVGVAEQEAARPREDAAEQHRPALDPELPQPGREGASSRPDGTSIFAGQRDDAFYGDIGSIFDLVGFRKGTGNAGGGKDFFAGYAVHAIALQIPISELKAKNSTIGVWSSTERQNVTVDGKLHRGWTQVSRIGNPLVNEVVVPTPFKDAWNRSAAGERQAVRRPGRHPGAREADEPALQAERAGNEP